MTHLIENSPVHQLLPTSLLEMSGELGFLVSASGTGKSTLLTHIGLKAITEEQKVLHISLHHPQQHVRARYDDVVQTLRASSTKPALVDISRMFEQNRLVHAHLDNNYSVKQCQDTLRTFKQYLDFSPAVVLIDCGSQLQITAENVETWRALADTFQCCIWFTINEQDSPLPAAYTLRISDTPSETIIHSGKDQAIVYSHNLCLKPLTQQSYTGTLFSGGAVGAESYFGEIAAQYGMREVHFTFPGHEQHRTIGSTELSPTELSLGSTSLTYVSKLLNRSWTRSPRLQKVLQVQWHLVSHADQVFVVGQIQPDNTVHGGTGWAVELAKRWEKSLWVYDQQRADWFYWNQDAWISQTPTITARNIGASGTRYLNHNGKQAIASLFERSFPSP